MSADIDRFANVLSRDFFLGIAKWIDNDVIEKYRSEVNPISSYNFPNLQSYFSEDTLANVKVVILDHIPHIPFSDLGIPDLSELASYQSLLFAGHVYWDHIMIRSDNIENESMFFHEICHTFQVKVLKKFGFLVYYAIGLLLCGYKLSPLENMIYNLQHQFNSQIVFSAEERLSKQLHEMIQNYGHYIAGLPNIEALIDFEN